jgi:hypothetical protein
MFSLIRSERIALLAVMAGLFCVLPTGSRFAIAQDSSTADQTSSTEKEFSLIEEGTRPLATVTFSSANRFVEEARYIFDAAESPDSFEKVEEWLASTLNNLEGFNRDKPFGLMVFLPAVFPPLPEFIAYVPVDSIENAQKLIEKAPVVVRKDPTLEGRYELIGARQTTPILIRNGYAFFPLGNNVSETILDRVLPEPTQLVASQARQFDVSATLDIASIPPATRILLTNVITAGLSSQLQQRDDEPDGAYEIRRAEGDRVLNALEQFLTECDRMTLGVDVVEAEQAINIDMVVDCLAGTKLFNEIFDSTTKPSYFIPLLDDTAAVSFSMSTVMAERDKLAYVKMLDGVKKEVIRQIELNNLGPVPDEHGAIGQALSALQATLDEGHIDTFAQFYTDADDKLAIVGAMRVKEGEAVAAGLQDALSRLQDVQDVQRIGEMEVGHGEHLGVTFHRLTLKNQPSEATEVFGQNVGITLGSGSRAVWFCMGGDESYATLTGVMDQLEAALQNPVERVNPANFRVIVNVNQLVEMQQRLQSSMQSTRAAEAALAEAAATTAEPRPGASAGPQSLNGPGSNDEGARRARMASGFARRREVAGRIFRETMAEGDDRVEVDFRPTETGGRMRIRLEEGFVKIVGRLITARLNPQE